MDESYPAKNKGMELLYGENCIILTSTLFDCDRGRDGQTGGWVIAVLLRAEIFEIVR